MKAGRDGTPRVEFEVRFPAGRKGLRRAQPTQKSAAPFLKPVPPRVPRITQLLVLGHHFEHLVRDGVIKNYSEIARLTGLSRARITQITSMTLLPIDVQEVMLQSPHDNHLKSSGSPSGACGLVPKTDQPSR